MASLVPGCNSIGCCLLPSKSCSMLVAKVISGICLHRFLLPYATYCRSHPGLDHRSGPTEGLSLGGGRNMLHYQVGTQEVYKGYDHMGRIQDHQVGRHPDHP